MRSLSPLGIVALSLILMLLGIALPLLMVLRVIPTGFLLSFFAYAASSGGLMLGIVGLAWYVRSSRGSKRW
ncbi:MAG: hypothetical protein FJ026_06795 [Chloroflexi bacterium]|nr:hypothetical protein [Chloroflexota bacterium]